MSASCAPGAGSDICPTQDALRASIVALLPRGRAWGTHEGGPLPGSTLYKMCDVLAAVRLFLEERVCALRREFFCATTREMRDLWLAEYGLPDECEPFPDLCAKVAAIGGATCDYVAATAQAAGWAVACGSSEACGDRVGARAGRARAGGGRYRATMVLEVDLAHSTAFVAGAGTPPLAGRLRAGRHLACPPDLDRLKCLVARIAPAHVRVIYRLVAVLPPSGVAVLGTETGSVFQVGDGALLSAA